MSSARQRLFAVSAVVLALSCAGCNGQTTTTTTTMTTTTTSTAFAAVTTTVAPATATGRPAVVPVNATPLRTLALPASIAGAMLWAAGPVSIIAMLFAGSPVNGLYSTSALAVIEFSGCYVDIYNEPLEFPESAWPGFGVGRHRGQHIRGALVANVAVMMSVLVTLFVVGVVLAKIKERYHTIKRRRQTQRARTGATAAPLLLLPNDRDESDTRSLIERSPCGTPDRTSWCPPFSSRASWQVSCACT